MSPKMREAQRLKKEKTLLLKKDIYSVVNKFETNNDGWEILTLIVGRDFDCHFAINLDRVELNKESFLSRVWYGFLNWLFSPLSFGTVIGSIVLLILFIVLGTVLR